MTLNYDIAVDLTPEFNRQLSPKFSVSLGDHGAREYTVQILQDGEPFVIEEGSTVSIVGKKSDGHIFAYACTYFDSFVRFTIEEQMTPVSGIVTCELSIIDASGNKVGSANFTYWVEPSPVTDGEASESDLQLFQQAVDAAGDVQRILDTFGGPNVAQKAEDMINTSKVYVYIGDETGFEYGHWYYYDTAASTWADGGIYQSDGVNTDKTLTTSGVPADAKATGDALAAKQDTLTFDSTPTEGSTNPVMSGGVWEAVETKADQAELAEVEAVTVVEVGTPTTKDILSELTWTEGWSMGTSGVPIEVSTLRYSNKIAVSEGDKIELVRPGGTTAARFVCAFSGDTAVRAKGAENVTEYTVPEGIDSIVITTYLPASSYSPSAIYLTALTYIKQNIYKNDIDALNTSVDAISEAVTVEDYTEESDRGETPVFTTGYMNNAGVINAEGSAVYFEYSQKIAVQPGDVVSTLSNGNSYTMRFVCAYNGDTVVSASGSSVDTDAYTVPDGIDGVVVTVRKSTNIDTINVFHQEAAKSAYVKPTPMGYMMEQGNLADGESMTLPYHNVKNGNVYIFNANIGTLGKIKFVKESSFYIEVDATNLIIVNDLNTYTVPHGITIANNITLMVCNETAATVSFVKVSSDGQEFSYTTARRFLMDSGTPTILSTGSALSECTFSWVSKNINAPIWLFGDSYFSWYENRWTYYLARDGYTKNCMLNGYAGEASAAAYDALENLLSVTQPEIVVWCMGMNDGDSATEVNANWKKYYDKLINMSKKYGFEIVLYTVPTTPVVNNTFKDAIIRESGYRYIEADKAVRIDDSGNWVQGALDPDNVHPTAIGAKILYHRILADLPEIMCNR